MRNYLLKVALIIILISFNFSSYSYALSEQIQFINIKTVSESKKEKKLNYPNVFNTDEKFILAKSNKSMKKYIDKSKQDFLKNITKESLNYLFPELSGGFLC